MLPGNPFTGPDWKERDKVGFHGFMKRQEQSFVRRLEQLRLEIAMLEAVMTPDELWLAGAMAPPTYSKTTGGEGSSQGS